MKPRLVHPPDDPTPGIVPILQRFQQAGYAVQIDPKGRFVQGMIAVMGGLTGFDLLRDAHIRRLFANAQLRKGTAHTFKELLGIVKPHDHHDLFVNQLHDLVLRGVFFRGYRLACPACDLETWYALADTHEQIACKGCRSVFQMPLEQSFAYAPNELFAQGLREGAMTVLLTALWLAEQHPTLMWQPGLIVRRGKQSIDVDLAVQVDEQLILVECKDNFKDRDVDDLIAHLQRLITLAQEVDATQVIFATLREELPRTIISVWNDTQSIQVSLLTGDDLTVHQNGP